MAQIKSRSRDAPSLASRGGLMFYTYVYHTHADASVPTYVGKGSGNRYKAHTSSSVDTHFARHVRKQLRDGIFPIIVKFPQPSEGVAFAEERRLIDLYGRKDLGTGSLYNKTDGGDGPAGAVRSPQQRENIRQARFTARPVDERTRRRLSEQATARHPALIEASLNSMHTPEASAKRKQSLKKFYTTPEGRGIARDRALAVWAKRKGGQHVS